MKSSHLPNNRRPVFIAVLAMVCTVVLFACSLAAQVVVVGPVASVQSRFRIGEKLTYNVSFGKFTNAAYVEMSVVSRGLLSGREAVELRSRLKTLGVVGAAFFQYDESRTVFAAPDTGLPLYVSVDMHDGPLPRETISNYLKEPTSSFDLLTLIYRARAANGTGTFPLFENEKTYTVNLEATTGERVKTDAGEFDTVLSTVQSDYLTANGIKELKVNFTSDNNRIPALIRVKTEKGIFRASLAAVQLPKPAVEVAVMPTKTPAPNAVATQPKPTPIPYVPDEPILSELGFSIGETLDYRITDSGRPLGTIALAAKERKMFQNEDSLLLTATVTRVEQGNGLFAPGDSIRVQVDPETLAPRWIETRFAGELRILNQTATFDRNTGSIALGDGKTIEAPIGTHTMLSLLYAMRSFYLRPSKDPNNPVNDTRVAVLWESQPYIFTLRPSNPEEIIVSGEKVWAQSVTVKTGNKTLDQRDLKIWLSVDGRVPVRFAFGTYQADLATPSKALPR